MIRFRWRRCNGGKSKNFGKSAENVPFRMLTESRLCLGNAPKLFGQRRAW